MRFRRARNGSGFAPWLDTVKGRSGVYVIRSPFGVEYVGESHTGNLDRSDRCGDAAIDGDAAAIALP